MAIVRINGKEINTVNGKKVRAIHYGDKTWYLEEIKFTYEIMNDEVIITGYIGTDTDITIPNTIEGKNVTTIETKAFSQENLTSVVFPLNMVNIKMMAFYINDIVNITIDKNVKYIGYQCFESQKDSSYKETFENVYYNGSIEQWCSIQFGGKNDETGEESLAYSEETNPMTEAKNFYLIQSDGTYIKPTELSIGSDINPITEIKNFAFDGFEQIINVEINNITSIGHGAFYNCINLNYITISSMISYIGDHAFSVDGNLLIKRTIKFKGYTPPTIESDSLGTEKDGLRLEIIVPKGYGDIYKTWDSNWESYAFVIVEEE